jgi:hypothetical protein
MLYKVGRRRFMGGFEKKPLDRFKVQPVALQNWTFPVSDMMDQPSNIPTLFATGQPRWSFIELPNVRVVPPAARLFFPRRVSLWVPAWAWDKTARELCVNAQSYEDYLIQLAEDAILYIDRAHTPSEATTDAARRERGRALALDLRIKKTGLGLWSVPSSVAGSGPRLNASKQLTATYEVDTNAGTCTCPDYTKRKKKCKHQYAIEHLTTVGFTYSHRGTVTGRLSSKGPNLQWQLPRSTNPPAVTFLNFEPLALYEHRLLR